jgi:ADP-heptose:LPS heptosyltransferase
MRLKLKQYFRSLLLRNRGTVLNALKPIISKKNQAILSHPDISSILIITQTRLGDAIVSLPFIKDLKNHFSHAKVTVLTYSYCQPIFNMAEIADEILFWKENASIFSKILFAIKLQKWHFSVTIDLNLDYTIMPPFCSWLIKPRMSTGFDIENRGVFFTHPLPAPSQTLHIADQIFILGSVLGLTSRMHNPMLHVTDDAKNSARTFLTSAGIALGQKIAVIHVGGYYATQRWPIKKFEALCARMAELSIIPVVAGDTRDKESILRIKNTVPAIISCIGNSLDLFISILSLAEVFIGNNSGPLHCAAAVDIPTVSTMGPTVMQQWKPLGSSNIILRKNLPCIGCNSGVCRIGTHECMKQISVDDMFVAVKRVIPSDE